MYRTKSNSQWLILLFTIVLVSSFGILEYNMAFADTVISTISLGNHIPVHIAVNPVTNKIYVSDEQYFKSGSIQPVPGTTLSIIDGSTNTVVNNNVGFTPGGIAVNPVTNKIYVSEDSSDNVAVIDGNTDGITNTIQVGRAPYGIVVNPNTNMIYVDNYNSNTVSVIDGSTDSTVSTIQVGSSPFGIGVNPTTNMVYVANLFSNTVSVINGTTNTVVSTIPVGAGPGDVAVNPITNKIYVTYGDLVAVINGTTNTVIGTISSGSGPQGIDVNSATDKVYVAVYGSNTIAIINGTTDSVMNTISDGGRPIELAINHDTNKIYVSNNGGRSVTVIDGNSEPTATSQLQVNSQDSSGNELTGYYTELYAQNGTQIDSGYTPNNFTLDNGQTYTVHVENYGNFKFNHWQDTSSTDANRTISITSDQSITAVYAIIPTHPSNLTATAVSPSEIDLSWNAPSSDGGSTITGYRIQSSTDGSTWTTIVKNTGNTNTAYSDTGLSADTTYYYRVFALNSVGSSYRSNIASATTPILAVAGTNIGTASILP